MASMNPLMLKPTNYPYEERCLTCTWEGSNDKDTQGLDSILVPKFQNNQPSTPTYQADGVRMSKEINSCKLPGTNLG